MVALREQVNLTVEKGTKLKPGTDQKSPLEGGRHSAGRLWWLWGSRSIWLWKKEPN